MAHDRPNLFTNEKLESSYLYPQKITLIYKVRVMQNFHKFLFSF